MSRKLGITIALALGLGLAALVVASTSSASFHYVVWRAKNGNGIDATRLVVSARVRGGSYAAAVESDHRFNTPGTIRCVDQYLGTHAGYFVVRTTHRTKTGWFSQHNFRVPSGWLCTVRLDVVDVDAGSFGVGIARW